jgi:hypothetical protein
VKYQFIMKTCTLSKAKSSLKRLADEALKGHPTVITHGGKLLILQAHDSLGQDTFGALIDEGVASRHFSVTEEFWKGVRSRGRKLARRMAAKR